MIPGFDPLTGKPYSDKNKTTAGLLQLLLGLLLALGGVGRLYAGHTGIGATQMILSVGGWIITCAGGGPFGLLLLTGAWLWAWIDGIVMLAGHPVDGQGRPLRP
jgi:TM2 domain-containing membrane protein YozV